MSWLWFWADDTGGVTPPAYSPSLDFSDDRNSQYWMFFI